MSALPLPQGAWGMMPQQQQQPAEPFVYGKGGRRLTPDEVEMQRKLGMAQMQGGADYSPIQHWTQGLARASQGILGGMQVAEARKAGDANAAESSAVARALVEGGSGPDNESSVLDALVNPYVDDRTRGLAEMRFKAMQPKQKEPNAWEQMLLGAGLQPGTEQWRSANADAIRAKNDPIITVSLPGGGIFNGPQSELANVLQGGGGQTSGAAPGATPAAPPPEAVQALQRGEGSPEQFDELFGPGSAARFMQGGPVQSAPGNFRQ